MFYYWKISTTYYFTNNLQIENYYTRINRLEVIPAEEINLYKMTFIPSYFLEEFFEALLKKNWQKKMDGESFISNLKDKKKKKKKDLGIFFS